MSIKTKQASSLASSSYGQHQNKVWASCLSLIIHAFIIIVIFIKPSWLSEDVSSHVPPQEITVEIVNESPLIDLPENTILKRSGPDEEGLDQPKTINAAEPTIQIPNKEAQIREEKNIQEQLVQEINKMETLSQPQINRPHQPSIPLKVPIPVPSSNEWQKTSAALFNGKKVVRLSPSGKGVGDIWLNAVKADLGSVDTLLSGVPEVKFPAVYILVVDMNGKILFVSVQKSSGVAERDQAVISSVYRSSPVPAPPRGIQTPVKVILEINNDLL